MPNHELIITIFLLIFSNNNFVQQVIPSSLNCDNNNYPQIFSYPSFNTTSCNTPSGGLLCMGAVVSGNGFLNMTAVPPENSSATVVEKGGLFNKGRVLYKTPVQAWPTSFCTSFSIKIIPNLNEKLSADGMAFVMAQDNLPSPSKSFGSYHGLQDQTLAGTTKIKELAIVFDTFKNEWDIDDNHIAINTIHYQNPLVTKTLSPYIKLKSGKPIRVKVEYNGWEKQLQIYVGYEGNPLISFLNHSIKLSKQIPSQVYVGFTASTGTLAETHQVLDWIYTSTTLPYSSLHENERKKTILVIVLPILLGVLILVALCAYPIVRQRMIKKKERIRRMEELERQSASVAPRKFTYKQLVKATKNFSKDKLLGTGGFGSVYKGHITSPPQTIAVKRISANSNQGEREYLAEITTIGKLRHKNLLQLQGWCHENEHLLLVYDYMPNKSFVHFMVEGEFINWNTRYKILTGLGSALLYLHEECGDPIVHRDVKPSNIMLDEEFNPRLGDFGLARLVRNVGGVTTNVAGTLGYMAPEISYTGKATTETDVYSYGVVTLEVVCGKKFIDLISERCLVDYVWEMHIKNSLLECVDLKLGGDFEPDQAKRTLNIALACLLLDSNLRPTMRKVVQVLINPDEPLINLPKTRTSGVHASVCGLSNRLYSGTSDSATFTDETFTNESLLR